MGADHLRRHGDRPPADQVSAALAQAELHWAAVGVLKGTGVIAEDLGIAVADGQPNLLLDALLAHS